MKTVKKIFLFLSSPTIAISLITITTLQSTGKVIIIDGTSTSGKTSICRKLENCQVLSYDKTVANLFAEVIEKKIVGLDDGTITQLVEYQIVSMEEGEGNSTKYKLPRNDLPLLFHKAALLAKHVPRVTLGYSRTEEDRENLAQQTDQKKAEQPIVLLTEKEKAECIEKIEQTMFKEAIKFASQGQNVVIDTVIENLNAMKKIRDGLQKYEPYFVLVYCPINDIVTRVRRRNEKASQEGTSLFEARKLNQPLEQLVTMYKPTNTLPETKLSLAPTKPQNSFVSKNDINFVFESGKDLFDKGFDIEKLRQDMMQKFDLENNDSVQLVPNFPHNLIVNNSSDSQIQSCVEQIQKVIDGN